MKLHIIGSAPSAGKTTLARAIAARTGMPAHELDGLMFVDDRWTLRPAAERDAMLARILEEPSFVTEGGFLGWTEAVFEAADHIVWLDPPLWVLTWRHVRRFWRHAPMLPSLLAFQWRMYLRPSGRGPLESDPKLTREGVEAALRPHAAKVFRITHAITAEELISRLDLHR